VGAERSEVGPRRRRSATHALTLPFPGRAGGGFQGAMPKLTPKQIQMFVVIGVCVAMPMVAMLAVAIVVVVVDFMAGG
jgi:hypothetical protein